ncbi:MAG: MarR family winged helix-turn-helix transcriptional regulator [Pseudomonadota bacterium]
MIDRLPDDTIRTWARLVRVQQDLLDHVEADLKAAGLPPLVWYDVLLELVREPDGRLRYRDLQARLLLAKHNLSRLLDRLAAEDLITREAVADDARGACIVVTAAGRQLQKRIWPVYHQAIATHFAGKLSGADVKKLGDILDKLRR